MMKKRIQHDVTYLINAGLLVVSAVVAITGLVSDLWDLNDFVYHTYPGYAFAILGLAHVYLHWGQLVAYARWRLGKRPRCRRRAAAGPSTEVRQAQRPDPPGPSPDSSGRDPVEPPLARAALRALLSRRGFVGLALGGLGGFALGRGLRSQPDLPYGADVGAIYHEWSKFKLLSLLGTVSDWGRQPDLYKGYTWAEQISLPPPDDSRGLLTEVAIRRRRSVRDYSPRVMSLEELSRLLYFTGGINEELWGNKLRSAPSAGALYPIEVYVVAHRVVGLEPGLYHYAVRDHSLELLHAGDLRGEIVRHGLMQEFLGQANVVLVFTAIFQRLRWRYQERTYRYTLLEAGHLGQNVYLVATSMGMGACAVGAFLDDGLNAMLEVDGQHEGVIYMLAVGGKKPYSAL